MISRSTEMNNNTIKKSGISLKRVVLIAVAAALAAAAVTAWLVTGRVQNADNDGRTHIEKAVVPMVKDIVALSTVEISEEFPFRGSIGNKHLFARQRLEGRISFDLEALEINDEGDTLLITLPPEKLEIYESTRPGSYIVYDTWNDRLFGSSQFSASEENKLKSGILRHARSKLYTSGKVARARAEATKTLLSLTPALLNAPVKVVDPRPKGYPELNDASGS